MPNFKIAVIPGDGVGLEVIPEGIRVLDAAGKRYDATFEYTRYDWGSDYYFRHGRMMPPNGIDLLRPADAIFLGAIGHPDIPDHITLNGLLLPIRRSFDQYACVRPAFLYKGVRSPLAGKEPGSIDFVVIRENTEGEYSQAGGFLYPHTPEEVAIQTSVFTRRGIERVVRYAFDLARRRNKKRRLCSITKSNALGFSMVLWDRTFADVVRDYPDISTESLLVDAAAMNFIRRPESFDVVVASNLFGDILTDIAGKGIVNPLATILSAGMMLEFLGLEAGGKAVEQAVAATLAEGKALPADLGGKASTRQVTDAVLSRL